MIWLLRVHLELLTVVLIWMATESIHGQDFVDLLGVRVQFSKSTNPPAETENLITNNGFMAEHYDVITDDKYILRMYRIVDPNRKSNRNKPVVVLGHGLFASSAYWLTRGRDQSLAFILADNNFDVWLLNFRGNSYSKRHVYLKPNDTRFWDYSFHEMGLYDLPNSIDFILKKTLQKNVMYIGHSMGTTIGFVTCSIRPKYNTKFRLLIAFGPVTTFKHRFTAAQNAVLSFYPYLANQIIIFDQRWEILPRNDFLKSIMKLFCSPHSPTQQLCQSIYFLTCGSSPRLFNATVFTSIFDVYPDGNSFFVANHYYENLITAKFSQRNYGRTKNFQIYKQQKPPEYPLGNVSTNVAIYYGRTDDFSTDEDMAYLTSQLPNTVLLEKINFTTFNHGDYLFGNYANEILYKNLIKFMQSYVIV